MSFFIPGRTRCAICGEPLVHRVDAAQLSTISPAVLPEWAKLSRAFVHRLCWEHWPHRDAYACAARNMLLQAPVQETERRLFERDGLFLIELPSVRIFRILDTWAPLTADVPAGDAAGLPSAVLAALSNHTALELTVGSATWTLIPTGEGDWELTLSHEREPFERVRSLGGRQALWLELMRKLQRATG